MAQVARILICADSITAERASISSRSGLEPVKSPFYYSRYGCGGHDGRYDDRPETVMDYSLKPLKRAQAAALGEP